MTLLSIFIGGGLGAVLRYLIGTLIHGHWGTFVINVTGAFCIGMAYHYCSQKTNLTWKPFIMTGLLGGFTTFSTYMLEFNTLINQSNFTQAVLYLLLSILVGCLFLRLGMIITF